MPNSLDMICSLSNLRSKRSQDLCGVKPLAEVDKYIKEKVSFRYWRDNLLCLKINNILPFYYLDPIFICENCGAKSCYFHKVAWHENQTCEQYDKREKPIDSATEIYLSEKTKRCPSCKMYIQRVEGCSHMTCRCSYEFCWL
jgi:hypothetical protein